MTYTAQTWQLLHHDFAKPSLTCIVQGYHKGVVSISHTTIFRNFLLKVSERIPGLDPQHFHVVIVCSRANAPADARQYIPIHETTVRPLLRSTVEATYSFVHSIHVLVKG